MTQPLLKLNQAAAALGIHPRTLRLMIADGQIGWVRVGERGVRIAQADLEDYIQARRQPATRNQPAAPLRLASGHA